MLSLSFTEAAMGVKINAQESPSEYTKSVEA